MITAAAAPEPFERSFTQAAQDDEFSVDVCTVRGIPDYIFIRMIDNSEYRASGTHAIKVKHIRFNYIGQDYKTVSDYSYAQLKMVTRRNSHPLRSQVDDCVGGVLLSRKDFAGLQFYRGLHPTLEFKIIVDECEFPGYQMDVTLRCLFIYENFELSGVAHGARFWQV